MREYIVQIPLTGYVEVSVIAETEEEAISEAFEKATLDDVAEWELHEIVSHAVKSCIEVFDEGEVEE